MTLEQFWKILVKQWKLILICFVVVGAGTFGGSKLMKPIYQSSTLIQVAINSGNSAASYDNLLASEQLVQTEADLATSTPVLNMVVSKYPDLTIGELAQEVSSSPVTNTQLFQIIVADHSPTQAASLANDIANALIEEQAQQTQQQNEHAQQGLQQNITQTRQQIDQVTSQISSLQGKAGNQGQIAQLQAQLAGLQQQYGQLQVALAQLQLTQAQAVSPLQIVEPAHPADRPVRPNVTLYTAGGLLVGLLLGILLALLVTQMDSRVRTPEELTQQFTWPALATIWQSNAIRKEELIGPTGRDVNVEAYRILRTNIGFAGLDKPIRSLTVTSSVPGEGKSTVAANLAIFMARAGKNTLLIDADLRRPSQHELFNLSSDKLGLSNAVLSLNKPTVQKTPFQDVERAQPSNDADAYTLLEPFVHSVGVPNLWVMPSGPLPPNPSEFLESQAMKHFLTIVANCGVEMLIIDTPPLVGLSDTNILLSRFDGVLLVADMTQARKEKLKLMKAALSRSGARVLGYVANKMRHKRNDVVDYYYTQDQPKGEKPAKSVQLPSTPMPPAQVSSTLKPPAPKPSAPVPPTPKPPAQVALAPKPPAQVQFPEQVSFPEMSPAQVPFTEMPTSQVPSTLKPPAPKTSAQVPPVQMSPAQVPSVQKPSAPVTPVPPAPVKASVSKTSNEAPTGPKHT